MREALGMIEVKGLVVSIEVSDAMVKAADVQLTRLNITKGIGWVMIAVTGNVGAVNAAIAVGEKVAVNKNSLVSSKVIARPIDDIFQKENHSNNVIEIVSVEEKMIKDNKEVVNKASDSEETPNVNKKDLTEVKNSNKLHDDQEEKKSSESQKNGRAKEVNEASKKLKNENKPVNKSTSATKKLDTTTQDNKNGTGRKKK